MTNPSFVNLLQTVLVVQRKGFAVWLADSGRSALEIYRERQVLVSVVLMDVRMPDLDGPQTLSAMQRINPAVACCFMTGYAGEYTPEGLLAMEGDPPVRQAVSRGGNGPDPVANGATRGPADCLIARVCLPIGATGETAAG